MHMQNWPVTKDKHIRMEPGIYVLIVYELVDECKIIKTGPIFSARYNIYISRLCYDVSVRLSVTEVHWRIIANLGFKFRSQFTTHCGRGACGREHWTIYSSVGAREGMITGKSGGIISRYASHC